MREIRSAVVTGPTHSIGQALCRLLLSEGIRVYAVCRPDSPRVKRLPVHPALRVILCDLSQMETLPQKMDGETADAFFHLGWAGNDGDHRNDMRLQTDNIRYTLDACHAAAALSCKVFIGSGSQSEYGRQDKALTPETPCFPENGYGMAKLCAGQMSRAECRMLGVDHIWARFLSVYGPYEQFSSMTISTIRKLLHREVPAMTAGEQLWDYLYSGDAADALLRLARAGKNEAVYPVGSGTVRPLREYVEMLRDAVDPALRIDFGAVPYGAKQIMHLCADISRLTADTGFVPGTEFREGIRRTVEWVKSNE